MLLILQTKNFLCIVKANLPLSPHPHPSTDSHQILHYVIMFTTSYHMPHLVKIAPGVSSPHIAKVAS